MDAKAKLPRGPTLAFFLLTIRALEAKRQSNEPWWDECEDLKVETAWSIAKEFPKEQQCPRKPTSIAPTQPDDNPN
ncbi:hypothetical protein QBC39DRAFT_355318 [Podospora conica]|nr:hypothetical protein QBC39DRAFT_355318 [Schizothecium conicum]